MAAISESMTPRPEDHGKMGQFLVTAPHTEPIETGRTIMTAITDPAEATSPGFWRRYGALWTGAPKEFLVIIALFVIAQVSFSIAWGLFAAGLGLLAVFLLGIFFIAAAFYVARGVSWADAALLRWAGRPAIEFPTWPSEPGFLGWLKSLFTSPHSWLQLAYLLLPQFVLAVVSFSVTITVVSIALSGLLWPVWAWFIVRFDQTGGIAWLLERWWGLEDGRPLEAVIMVILGLIFAFLLPYVTRGLSWAHWGVARVMVGAFPSEQIEQLEQELAGAQASRAAAVSAEDTALRRLERDIHDGPQQRLIRLQMDLASADRRLADDPEKAHELLEAAREQAREALEELRALSRGFAPPILQDRGLVAALESAAVRSAVPTQVVNEIPPGTMLPPELERNAYFIASEALTNAGKHADATAVRLRVALTEEPRALELEVEDDGRGGAQLIPGHGLDGLDERVRGLGGTLEVTSPEGGPTRISTRLPW